MAQTKRPRSRTQIVEMAAEIATLPLKRHSTNRSAARVGRHSPCQLVRKFGSFGRKDRSGFRKLPDYIGDHDRSVQRAWIAGGNNAGSVFCPAAIAERTLASCDVPGVGRRLCGTTRADGRELICPLVAPSEDSQINSRSGSEAHLKPRSGEERIPSMVF